jgi:hypothetical protein
MRQWRRSVVVVVLLAPSSALAHSYLLSPPPRAPLTVRQGNPPCGGDPRGTSPTVLVAGQTLQVQFREVQSHGDFEILFSAANDQGFASLATIPNPPTGDTTQTVTLPAVPCDACTLQLIQKNGANPGNFYYSCADVQLLASAGSTTTTTTIGSGTTTTTTEPDPTGCAALGGFDEAECRLTDAQADSPCPDGTLDAASDKVLDATLRKARSLLLNARSRTRRAQIVRLLRKADRRLAKTAARLARVADARGVSDICKTQVDELIDKLRAVLAALQAAA